MMFFKETCFQETPTGKVPRDWDVVELEKLGEKVRAGGTPLTSKREYWNGSLPFVKIEDITLAGKYLARTKSFISGEGLRNSSAWIVPENSLLFALYGSMGEVTINTIPVTTNQAILGIIPHSRDDVEFLYYWYAFFKPKWKKYAKPTTQANLTAEILRNSVVPLPPEKERRAISKILGVVDLAIAKAGEVIAKIERLKKGLMQELLTKGIGHKEYKQTPTGKTPRTWQTVPLKTVVKSYKNGIYKPNEYYHKGYPCIRMYNIVNGRIDTVNATLLDVTEQELEDYGLERGDVIVNRVNTPELVGKAGVVPEGFGKATFESKNIRVRLDNKKILPEFFSVFVQTTAYAKQVLSRAKIAVAQATITQDDLNSLLIPLPPTTDEQRKIAEIISTVDKKLELEKKEKTRLERIKQGLMDLLLTGKIRVKVD